MTLEKQLQIIIDDAENYGVPRAVAEKAIAPALKSFAQQLHHFEYYILQNLGSDWVLTTIMNPQLQQEKKVIYGFISVEDAATFQGVTNVDLIAMPISVVQLLFRFISLEEVDSIIFLENSQNLKSGIEIERDRLTQLIHQQIEQLSKIPPNIA
jgi:hypothetical protein